MKVPKTEKERMELMQRLARGGKIVTRGTGRVSEEFWNMPRPRDPEGLARRYLIEDRREGL
ncbi:MAG TPA: hypothetical protein VGP38_05460 [Rubrobacter sp.]|nr:hypothetical protein [Rubrobacter sp.]